MVFNVEVRVLRVKAELVQDENPNLAEQILTQALGILEPDSTATSPTNDTFQSELRDKEFVDVAIQFSQLTSAHFKHLDAEGWLEKALKRTEDKGYIQHHLKAMHALAKIYDLHGRTTYAEGLYNQVINTGIKVNYHALDTAKQDFRTFLQTIGRDSSQI
jgi:hypothetical protein